MDRNAARGAASGLTAAALFGASAPLAKLLLPGSSPLMTAALLYLGAGIAVAGYRVAARKSAWFRVETPLRRADLGLLVAIVALGGIAGPVLMLVGLGRTSGVAGALLLNLQAPFTILLAVFLFGDHIGRVGAAAALLITAAAGLLAWRPGAAGGDASGVAALAAACACWALDDNLNQRLTLRDPTAVVQVKTLGAGGCMLALALAIGQRVPPLGLAAASLGVGAVSYGISLVLDLRALRLVGAAREAAYFATGPFFGAVLAIPLLRERPGGQELAAAVIMGAGVLLLLRDRHGHRHMHEAIEHDHVHKHDDHHHHEHEGVVIEPHAHLHRHERLEHDHAHSPDPHHRHRHDPERTS